MSGKKQDSWFVSVFGILFFFCGGESGEERGGEREIRPSMSLNRLRVLFIKILMQGMYFKRIKQINVVVVVLRPR